MKIILGSESFAPNVSGVATATKNLANNLVKNGHEAFVFTPGKLYRTKIDRSFVDYPVYRLKSVINPFRHGYRITSVSDREIEKLLRTIKPDLIHIQDPVVIGQSLRRVGKKLGVPVVVTNHFSLEYALSYVKALSFMMPILRKMLVWYLVTFYNKCDHVITPTKTFKKQLESWGVKTPVSAISNGIETARFVKKYSADEIKAVKQKYALSDKPTVLYLGRIDKDKSIDVLVKSVPLVLEKIDAHFIIAGKGGEVENIKKLSSELKIKKNITFIGFLDHNSDDFVLIYKSASLFAIPSTIETQSLVTLEAMASSLPVVAADAGALPELAHNNINGFLFTPFDEKELAEKIIFILSDKDRIEKMGEESHKIAMTHEMNYAFAEMLELYKNVIKEK